MYSLDLRWRIVWARWIEHDTIKDTAERLFVSESLCYRVLSCYRKYNDVVRPGFGLRTRRTIITPTQAEALLTLMLDTPESGINEVYQEFCADHGLDVHYSTVLRAVHAAGFTRKFLRGFSAKRDAAAALRFKAMLVSTFEPKQLFFLDETSKDRRMYNRTFGWSLRGRTPISSCGFKTRGDRCSALCGMDIEGFVGWYIIRGTFKRAEFLEAVKQTVIPYIEPFPGKRSVLLTLTPHPSPLTPHP